MQVRHAFGCFLGSLLILLAGAAGPAVAEASLHLVPSRGPIGTTVHATIEDLAPEVEFELVWHTAAPEWVVEQGSFKGFRASPKRISLGVGRADAGGRAELSFTVPEDFGFVHNLTVEAAGQVLARQGFLVQPSLVITPTSGPPGMPIEVTVYGLGYQNYQFTYVLLYDNRTTGIVTAISTKGTARVVIPAVGEPGVHSIRLVAGVLTGAYLNVEQSPVYFPGASEPLYATFTVTEGPFVTPPSVDSQVLPREKRSAAAPAGEGPQIWTDYATGTVGQPFVIEGTGFPPGSQVQLWWRTVVGNRISGQGWQERESLLAEVTADGQGRIRWQGETPDDLGGPHRITARAGEVVAWTEYTIKPSLVAFEPTEVAPGQQLRLQLKGIGWTETENIVTVTHDNAYIGYACGFNSQGDVTILMPADTRPGWHVIELYPAIYKGDFGPINADIFRLPMLNVVDHPGERLPSFRVAYYVRP
ncbi:MAG: hypothetical protein IMX02_01890 [Limnochordaceae bacterium]|nr:hypothetical protein [Limnochordaceae bacterium]